MLPSVAAWEHWTGWHAGLLPRVHCTCEARRVAGLLLPYGVLVCLGSGDPGFDVLRCATGHVSTVLGMCDVKLSICMILKQLPAGHCILGMFLHTVVAYIALYMVGDV